MEPLLPAALLWHWADLSFVDPPICGLLGNVLGFLTNGNLRMDNTLHPRSAIHDPFHWSWVLLMLRWALILAAGIENAYVLIPLRC
jgi:hypothetical protein